MTDQPLPELVEGWCPWKESGPDGHRICMLTDGHDGDCDMQPVTPPPPATPTPGAAP